MLRCEIQILNKIPPNATLRRWIFLSCLLLLDLVFLRKILPGVIVIIREGQK